MSAGKSIFQQKPVDLKPKERGEGTATSVPQEVSSPNRRDKLINANTTSKPVADVNELNAL